jgi:GNAT superfamily N-acetyltransferase
VTPPISNAVPLTFRPAVAADDGFLFQLYASTRADELAPLGWNAAQRDTFLRGQFTAQRAHYRATFPQAKHSIVLLGKVIVGAWMVDRTPEEVRLVDLALLPQYRGHGIGTRLVRSLIDEARTAQRPLRLHVLKHSPAARLYNGLGFTPTGENGLYLKMEWRA